LIKLNYKPIYKCYGFLTIYVNRKAFKYEVRYIRYNIEWIEMSGKNKEIIQRHKPLTRADVKKKFQEMKRIKKELTQDAAILEKNLENFNKIVDPLVDPETEKVLCWVRRPTTEELESLIPAELLEYRGRPNEVPSDVMKKYKDFQFNMMANLIDNPKKSADWWKKRANQVFQRLFQLHLQGVMEDLGIMAENF